MAPLTKAEEIEKTLKAFWQLEEFRFIGKYNPHDNGKTAWFTDIRNLEGDILIWPPEFSLEQQKGKVSILAYPLAIMPDKYYYINAIINTTAIEKSIMFVASVGELRWSILDGQFTLQV